MKAISLWEPWASLIAVGAKRFETRSWSTKHRGPLLICAAKKEVAWTTIEDILYFVPGVREKLLVSIGCSPKSCLPLEAKHLPLGHAVVIANLVDCIRTETMTQKQIEMDRLFGDFSPRRFAWKLENIRPLKVPFPVKGKQGLFEVDDCLITEAQYGN